MVDAIRCGKWEGGGVTMSSKIACNVVSDHLAIGALGAQILSSAANIAQAQLLVQDAGLLHATSDTGVDESGWPEPLRRNARMERV